MRNKILVILFVLVLTITNVAAEEVIRVPISFDFNNGYAKIFGENLEWEQQISENCSGSFHKNLTIIMIRSGSNSSDIVENLQDFTAVCGSQLNYIERYTFCMANLTELQNNCESEVNYRVSWESCNKDLTDCNQVKGACLAELEPLKSKKYDWLIGTIIGIALGAGGFYFFKKKIKKGPGRNFPGTEQIGH